MRLSPSRIFSPARAVYARLAILQFASMCVLATVAALTPTRAQESDFYRGKTLTIFVGSDAGSGYDAYARLVGRHIGKHIPGSPVVVIQNQPGAGSITMANALANTGAKDGTAIGAPQSSVAFERLLYLLSPEGKAANFDATKLNWLGTAAPIRLSCSAGTRARSGRPMTC